MEDKIILTEYGRESLMVKLKTSLRFYNDEERRPVGYPINERMLGFPKWRVNSKEELYGRIIELSHLLNIELRKEIEVIGSGEDKLKKESLKIIGEDDGS